DARPVPGADAQAHPRLPLRAAAGVRSAGDAGPDARLPAGRRRPVRAVELPRRRDGGGPMSALPPPPPGTRVPVLLPDLGTPTARVSIWFAEPGDLVYE